jgi:hypothetical protein
MSDMEYNRINVDHIVFYKQYGAHTTMLTVYVDDMTIIGDDMSQIVHLKM